MKTVCFGCPHTVIKQWQLKTAACLLVNQRTGIPQFGQLKLAEELCFQFVRTVAYYPLALK
jgi:hypothetical protein